MHNKKEFIFSIALILGFLLPSNNIGYLVQGVLPLFLFLIFRNYIRHSFNRPLLFLFVVVFVSFVINLIKYDISWKDLLRFCSFSFLFLLFPFCPNIRIQKTTLYFILGVILFSQIAFSFGISSIVRIIDIIYPYEGNALGYNSEYILKSAGQIEMMVNRRYGGLYRNPNQCVRYVSVLLITFFIASKNNTFRQKFFFISLALFSVILSGSRTGLVVVLLIIAYNYMHFEDMISKFKKLILSFCVILVFFLVYLRLQTLNLRVFEISEGIEGSFGSKFDFFNHFYNQLQSSLHFLFGHFTNESLTILYGLNTLDSEWAEMFYSFGILGCITILVFYFKIFLLQNKNINFFMLILLWGITSTILFSFKMSFVFMLLLSNYYSHALFSNIKLTENE